jgi:transcriptional regulator with XRE-family HTH domain
MTLREKIGKAIIRLRKRLGYSQEQFAYDSNIDRRYMSDLENGKRNISIDVIERLAKSLGIQASTLLYEAENEGNNQDSVQSIKQWLCQNGHDDTIVFDSPSYVQAIIGISDQGRLIYSYDKMIDCLRLSDSLSVQEAIEFIDFNTIRALPYLGDKSPIIMYNI